MKVQESMSKFVISLEVEDTLLEAHMIMKELNCRHLPIVTRRKLIGILSDRDVLKYGNLKNENLIFPKGNVTHFMSTDVVSVYKDCQVAHAVDLMLSHKIDCLPITGDDGELVGIVTSTDLLELLKFKDHEPERVLPYEWNIKSLRQHRAEQCARNLSGLLTA